MFCVFTLHLQLCCYLNRMYTQQYSIYYTQQYSIFYQRVLTFSQRFLLKLFRKHSGWSQIKCFYIEHYPEDRFTRWPFYPLTVLHTVGKTVQFDHFTQRTVLPTFPISCQLRLTSLVSMVIAAMWSPCQPSIGILHHRWPYT